MYEEELKSLGLTDNEVRIYLVLLEKGMLNPYKIAEITGLHRGYIYDTLERMQEKGVVNTIIVKGKKHYQATSPENLIELLRLKMESLQKVVPDLTKIMSLTKEETNVQLHKGRDVIKIMLKDLIANAKKNDVFYCFLRDESPFMELEPIYTKRYFHIENSKNIREKLIIKEGGKRFKEKNLEYRELPEKYFGNSFYIIYASKIAFIIWGNPNYLIIIENKQYAETYRKQFGILWETAKKTR